MIGFLLSIMSGILSELIVVYLLKFPKKQEINLKYIYKRNVSFSVLNAVLFSICITFMDTYFSEGHSYFNLMLFFKMFGLMSFVSVLIGMFWRFVYQNKFLTAQLEEAQHINWVLQERQRQAEQRGETVATMMASVAAPANEEYSAQEETSTAEPAGPDINAMLHLTGETKDSLDFLPRDFLYAEAESNYVNVYYMKDEKLKKGTIRSTIKDVESTMTVYPPILRCHRAYVVNVSHVSKIDTHGGFTLVMDMDDKSVPVSRTYQQQVKERILNPVA